MMSIVKENNKYFGRAARQVGGCDFMNESSKA